MGLHWLLATWPLPLVSQAGGHVSNGGIKRTQVKSFPRLAGAPHKKAFIKAPMNLLGLSSKPRPIQLYSNQTVLSSDSFAIAPYYIGLVMETPPPELPPVVST